MLVISIVWLWRDFVHLRDIVYGLPSKHEIIEEIVTTRIPITMGPDGKPIIAGTDDKKDDKKTEKKYIG